jgi:hypothetical protein
MRNAKITALATAAAIAVTGIAPATGMAKATGKGKHSVTAESTYVYKQAGKIFDGTLFKGETFKVERISKSGKFAYGMAYGHVNRHAWIKAADLKLKR